MRLAAIWEKKKERKYLTETESQNVTLIKNLKQGKKTKNTKLQHGQLIQNISSK